MAFRASIAIYYPTGHVRARWFEIGTCPERPEHPEPVEAVREE